MGDWTADRIELRVAEAGSAAPGMSACCLLSSSELLAQLDLADSQNSLPVAPDLLFARAPRGCLGERCHLVIGRGDSSRQRYEWAVRGSLTLAVEHNDWDRARARRILLKCSCHGHERFIVTLDNRAT